MNAGAAGVVAMRYSVYVVTAAQFVAELYGALARGRTLGEAVAWARGNLADEPNRKIAYDARPLQDWAVPVVWERTPLSLWPQKPEGAPLRINARQRRGDGGRPRRQTAAASRGRLLRPRRDALCARSRLRPAQSRAAARLRRQRQDDDRGGIRALVCADRRNRRAGAVHEFRAPSAARPRAGQDRRDFWPRSGALGRPLGRRE